ncbi:MAG: hypothetical protein HY741_28715 [Chloroflexi bacterium]|nr:hypothetical protein [Chloroflexota bacterium]
MKSNWRIALFALALWAQLVLSLVMTLWRYDLVLWNGFQVYPSGVPKEYDAFIEFAQQVTPADSNLVYLSPTGDRYTARFARLHYLLYPRELLWLGMGTRTSALSRWTPVDLSGPELERALAGRAVTAVLVDEVAEPLPLGGRRLDFDPARYILILAH